jgi:Holliday junction resolvase RusA-like endonuclease
MRAICITIPGEPAAKGRPRIGKTFAGRPVAFTPAKTRTREGVIASLAMDAMRGLEPLAEPVRVHLLAVMPIPSSWPKKRQAVALAGGEWPAKKPDLDNLVKLATDGMNGIVWIDDALIVEIGAAKVYGEIPRTIVTVQKIGGVK